MSSSLPSSSAVLVARLSNLTPAVTGDHLRELLTDAVHIRELRMPEPVLWMSCPNGRAEVVGETDDDTKRVFVVLHGAQLDGQRINVSLVRVDPSLPPVVLERSTRAEIRPSHSDSQKRRGRRSRSHSRDRHHRHGDRHRRRSHSRGRRSRSPSEYSRSPRSRSPVDPRPPKQPRTTVTQGILPTPAPKPAARPPSRSPSPEWQ